MKKLLPMLLLLSCLMTMSAGAPASFAAPGSLDTTFYGSGFHRNGFGFGYDGATKVLAQPDGKIITVGDVENGEHGSILIVRYRADGSLDQTFGDGGTVNFGDFGVADAALQSDGKIVIAGSIQFNNNTTSDFIVTRYNPNGTSDTNFGNQGIARVDFDNRYDTARAMTLQPDGKIILVGSAGSSFGTARFNPEGSLDASFGSGGKKRTVITGNQESPYAVAVQPDGKIVAAGATISGLFCYALVRYESNGELDASFDNDGIVVTTISNSVTEPTAVAVQTDGKIVVGGNSDSIILLRYDATGSLDTTFGTQGTGIVRTRIRQVEGCLDLKLQRDGKIVVAGVSYLMANVLNFAVLRYQPNGTLDANFGAGGMVLTEFDNNHEIAYSVAIQGDDKIVAAGTDDQRQYDTILARYNQDGSHDPTFDGDGRVSYDFGSDYGESNAVAVQPDGKIVTAGYTNDFTRSYFAIARYHVNGRLDTTFGGTGRVVARLPAGSVAAARAVAVQTDGKIVVAGSGSVDAAGLSDFVAVRYNPDGTKDTTFDGDGVATFDVTLNNVSAGDTAYSIDIQPDGKILLGGTTGGSGTFADAALVRCNPDGSPDATFGVMGKAILRLPDYEGIRAIKVQPDGKIAVVGNTGRFSSFNGNTFVNDDFLVMRFNGNGSLDSTFDADGMAVLVWGNFPDTAADIALQPDGKIIAAGNYSRSLNRYNPALARFNVDGSLDQTFGAGGKVNTLVETDSQTFAVKLQSNGKIIVGGTAYDQMFRRDLLLLRYNAGGTLDNAFGTGGITRTDISGNNTDVIRDLTLDGFGRIVATGVSGTLPFAARFDGDLPSRAGIGGRVTNAAGQGIFGVTVRLSGTALTAPVLARTNNFGYYAFTDAPLGNGYTVSTSSKRYTFAPSTRSVDLGGDVTDIDFVSEQ
ncbi:MAG: hypothetical protein M3384_19210 [Acidobacteriota bacterium]|nr:hypothetical protein [Acidobacteriota bacterium]